MLNDDAKSKISDLNNECQCQQHCFFCKHRAEKQILINGRHYRFHPWYIL